MRHISHSSGQNSAVHLHLKEKNLTKSEDRCLKRGVKESIYVKLRRSSLNRGGGLRHYLSPTYIFVLSSLHRQLDNHSHRGSPSFRNPHEGRLALMTLKLRAHMCP